MTTTVVHSIGVSGRDYSTLQAWEDASPADLVSADQVWQGELYDSYSDGHGGTTMCSIGGSTTDATRYKHLTVAAGYSFQDHATASTNPLIFDSTKGVSLISQSWGYVTGGIIYNGEAHSKVSRLQIYANITGAGAINTVASGTPGAIFDSCILQSNSQQIPIVRANGGVTLRNCLLTHTTGGNIFVGFNSSNPGVFENCTFVAPSSGAPANRLLFMSYSDYYFTNCAAFNVTAYTVGTGTVHSSNCYTDMTATTGWTNIAFASAGFADTTNNWRITSGSALKDAGTTLSSCPADIMGVARPHGAAYDVGAHEYASAAAFKAGKPTVIGQAIGGMY